VLTDATSRYTKFTNSENLRTLLNDKPPTPFAAKQHLSSMGMLERLENSFVRETKLLKHQMVGLSWMLRQELEGGSDKCGGILADEMGLGKVGLRVPLSCRASSHTSALVRPYRR
jgi:SNF2 family DNA or RNA helicase